MALRQCPTCLSNGTLSPSHRRNAHETFLAVVAPFVYPYRCSACNWRGMMGRVSFVRHSTANIAINAMVYIAMLILAIVVLVAIREYLHPE
ncbi:MAG TPA: hypothetical protein VG537_02005 [Candidatus Kapabacteria bacterium]|jgi:hypothetical protein|nr:hypothetical protein [Candidatus Kapabacteria bacterium]